MIIFKNTFAFAHRRKLSDSYLNDCRECIFQFNIKNPRQSIARKNKPIFL